MRALCYLASEYGPNFQPEAAHHPLPPRYDSQPSQVLFTPIRSGSLQSCLGKLQNKGEWIKITFIIRLSRDSGNRMKTTIVINLTTAEWAFLHSVLTADHYFEAKTCLQAERWIRCIHIQLIFIICGFLKCSKAMLCLTEKIVCVR